MNVKRRGLTHQWRYMFPAKANLTALYKIHPHTSAALPFSITLSLSSILTAAAMVAALGLGKFYGSSLPRPRFYTDVKLSSERVDPPLPVLDPLLSWAEEAHWSMGGASMTRLRLQGRIEGNVNKLRVQRETLFKKSGKQQKPASSPAPRVIKRRRVVGLVDEEEEVGHEGIKNGAARKLGQNFGKNEVQSENDGGGEGGRVAAARKRSERKKVDLVVGEADLKKVNKKSAEARRRVGTVAADRSLAKIGRSR